MVNKSIYDFVCNSEASTLHNVLNNYSVSTENGVPEYEKGIALDKRENLVKIRENYC